MKRYPVTHVMTPDPVVIQRGQPISEAYHTLKRAPFHHLPVLEGDIPVGMLSSTDILRLVYDVDGTDDRTLTVMLDHQFRIEDAMTAEVASLPLSATVRDAAESLRDGTRHSVLVLDDGGGLAGIVTTTNLVEFILENYK